MSIGNFPESLSHAILAGVMLVGKLGVPSPPPRPEAEPRHPEHRQRYYTIIQLI